MGFAACVSDPCVFVRKDDNKSWIYVTLYVDDMLIGGVSNDSIKKVADEQLSHVNLKTLGKVRFILGIEVGYEMNMKQRKFSQSACIARMVEKIKIDSPVIVYEENQSEIAIAKNEGCQTRAKHIEKQYRFVRDQVINKIIQLE